MTKGRLPEMSDPYFLKTARLGFRHWTENDLELAMRLWGDPAVTRLFSKEALRPEEVKARLAKELENLKSYSVQYWPVFELNSGAHAGCCGLRPYRPEDNVLELGFHLNTAFWGQGLATEAARAVIDYAFETVGASALFAGHHPDNVGSRRVLEKLGFTCTGNELFEPTGCMHPTYMIYSGRGI